ncbi:MAG TPA: hypothetical protein VGN00_00265 [Puia sp.]|jgi:hypothetical protein
MKRNYAKQILIIAVLSFLTIASQAQYLWNSDSAFKAGSANSGRIWGYMFGDFYAKGHSDSAGRGANNQYTGIPTSRNAFQFRRIYLGYDYNISSKFSAELLLAAEDNFPAGNGSAAGGGDQLGNNKLSFYIKLANIRWKNIWKGTDLVVGQVATPAFPLLSERIWAYRSIERTISDIRRTPSYDLGAALQGKFDAKGNFGYNLMVANGSSAKPEADNFKWFYADVWAMALDKKLIFDIYGDYERLNWTSTWHHSRQMTKAYIAYNTPALTVGVEGYVNVMKNDNLASRFTARPGGASVDTMTSNAMGISAYVHGDIIKGKLRFFARYDNTKPNSKVDAATYKSYGNASGNNYDYNNKEQFITAGLDYTPVKNVHFMPNIWYNNYKSENYNAIAGSKLKSDYDAVYRLTFYFVFGK